MCGIVGLFLKTSELEPQLGALLSDMLIAMTDRGPDSAGLAIYQRAESGRDKLTIQSPNPAQDFATLQVDLAAHGVQASVDVKSTHAIISCDAEAITAIRSLLPTMRPRARVLGVGESIEIYKEVGLPKEVVSRFAVRSMRGTHGIGHTRMATESSVTTLGAHPFSTGPDQCLVHNGSLSNHNNLRRSLIKAGMTFETENDTEVAAAYLSSEMAKGKSLGEALKSALSDLDGFYTFVVGTKTGFGVLRDPIACKPAVLAETDQYVAFGTEYRALVGLPGIEGARVWEPEPATVYFWDHRKAA